MARKRKRVGASMHGLSRQTQIDTLIADGRIEQVNPGAVAPLYKTVHPPRGKHPERVAARVFSRRRRS